MGTLKSKLGTVEQLADQAQALSAGDSVVERFAAYRDRPVAFVTDVLGATPQPYQQAILAACAAEDRIVWRAGHGVGKTCLLSWVLMWWLLTRPFSRVLILAPAFERQVGRYLLPEVRRWARRAPADLPIHVGTVSVEVQGHERSWFALGVQASDPEKVEGGHAESLAVLADEAKGLSAEVIAALHGTQTSTTGDRLYLLASVPGAPSGPFYDAFRNGLWATFHTPATESAVVAGGWIEERRAEWGEGSPVFQARVMAEFPEQDEGVLIKLSDLEAAVGRRISREDDEPPALAFGVDVARYGGDRSVLAVWRGMKLERLDVRQGLDTMALASWISSEINRQNPQAVIVDEIGVGSGVVDRLIQLGHPQVAGLNVGSAATRSDIFMNRRAEVYWDLREAFERGEVSIPNNEALLAELSALRYAYSQHGRIKLEAKEETKRRVGRSPDLADALALGFAAVTGAGRHAGVQEEVVADFSGALSPGGVFGPSPAGLVVDEDRLAGWRPFRF